MRFPLLLLISSILTTCANEVIGFEIADLPNSISGIQNEQVVWRYNHDVNEGKPYFHPLATVHGEVLTELRPADHPWHRALWFSWKYINGINYWEEDRKTGLSDGQTRIVTVKRQINSSKKVQIQMKLEYYPRGNPDIVLIENRTLIVHPPDESGAYRIDWKGSFQAVSDEVILDRTPIAGEENSKPFGGYAGLSVRLNKDVLDGVFENSNGINISDDSRLSAKWIIFTHPDKGSVLILDHPDNIRHPNKWYVADKMPYFSPAVIHDGPFILRKGELLKLQYRVVVAPGRIGSQQAEQEWGKWSNLVPEPTTVLLLSGQSNHNWQETTPLLKSILESDERISVRVENAPETMTKEDFSGVDVILSNWNSFGNRNGKPSIKEWPESTRNAYVEFVRDGGGHVVIHGGSSSFYDWDEYFAITLMRWKSGQTNHGKKHAFPVRVDDTDHPLTEGMNQSEFNDELWRMVETHKDAKVIASSFSKTTKDWEPCVMIGQFGKGRCFSTTLGHDTESLNNPKLKELLIRAITWIGTD